MAVPESRRRKLDLLTRSLSAGDLRRARTILESAAAPPRVPADAPAPRAVSLEQAVPGQAVAVTGHGEYWLVRRRLRNVSGDAAEIERQYRTVLLGARQRFDELSASAGLCHVANGDPDGPLFMDIETCGLAGCMIFLVGTMFWRAGGLCFEQRLARQYGEEPAILAEFARQLESASVLVTFNGRAFDMTAIRARCAFHGLSLDFEPPHLDLLLDARKRWRGRVPNCRLQTLEQYLCRRRRVDDIPSSAIPDAYHRFVADGQAGVLAAIMRHNLLDLLTLAQLVCALLTGQEPLNE